MSKVDELPPHPDDRCWLKHHVLDTRPKVRISQQGGGGREQNSFSITLTDLTKAESDAIEAAVHGHSYIRIVDGRVWAYDANKPLPKPEEDPIMVRYWDRAGEITEVLNGSSTVNGWHSPDIYISHLLGKDVQRDMSLLESYGFFCMRSRREQSAGYWEIWRLPVWRADGGLQVHMSRWKEANKDLLRGDEQRATAWQQEVNEIARYIARDARIEFGTLDVSVQRWAMVYDD